MNITLMIPYYENPNMLREHIRHWSEYPNEVKEQLRIILIDDGSPRNTAKNVLDEYDLPVKVQLYRIDENIPWNYTGAKNLGFHVALSDDWILSIDMDHVVTAASMVNLLSILPTLDPEYYYKPARYAACDGKRLRPHSLSFIIMKDLFWRAGGYDEDYAGQRFGAAGAITKALRRKAQVIELEDVWIIYYNRNVIDDCDTRDFTRERSHKLRKNGRLKGKLRFKWEEINVT